MTEPSLLSAEQVAEIRALFNQPWLSSTAARVIMLCDEWTALRAERDAWEEWASHQEWCAVCAESSPDDCTKHDGRGLKARAHEFLAARSPVSSSPPTTASED